jgi:hypothetical protein
MKVMAKKRVSVPSESWIKDRKQALGFKAHTVKVKPKLNDRLKDERVAAVKFLEQRFPTANKRLALCVVDEKFFGDCQGELSYEARDEDIVPRSVKGGSCRSQVEGGDPQGREGRVEVASRNRTHQH